MKYLLLILITFSLGRWASAQNDSLRYLILFTDKNNTTFSLQNPEHFLSDKALARRQKMGIPLDQLDLPVSSGYINELRGINGIEILYSTKWLNGAVISFSNPSKLTEVGNLPFVLNEFALRSKERPKAPKELFPDNFRSKSLDIPMSVSRNVYGDSFDQIAMHRGHLLHEAGFTGEGVDIAVMDAGYSMTDQLPVFDHLRSLGLIQGSKDFVDGDDNVYHGSSHGSFVLSTIAGYMPDSIIGTAPYANYWLFRTEDTDSESPLEEINWIAAAEFADSAGVDLMTTSLGYSQFDNASLNYSTEDMDGNTAWITRGSEIAASRGIVVFSSAGNKGNDEWRIITAPADGRNVISVAAVGRDSSRAFFSSFGPSSDDRIKPNVVALGLQSTYANFEGGISRGNGTSFSCPILAGLAACLIQANPRLSASKIKSTIERSSSLFYFPNDSLGFGIPDMWEAHLSISQGINLNEPQLQALVYPNPFQDRLTVIARNTTKRVKIQLFDTNGREVPNLDDYLIHETDLVKTLELSFLPSGFYVLRIVSGDETLTKNILKGPF